MDNAHPLKGPVAFVMGGLFVVWIGGLAGIAGFKMFSWLVFGVWPETAVSQLMPGVVLRFVLGLRGDAFLAPILGSLLRLDVLTGILLGPPLVLAPCLLLLWPRRTGPVWRLAGKPFAARSAGPDASGSAGTGWCRRGMTALTGWNDSTTDGLFLSWARLLPRRDRGQ